MSTGKLSLSDLLDAADNVRTFAQLESFLVSLANEARGPDFVFSNVSLTDYINGLAGSLAIYINFDSLADDAESIAEDLKLGVPFVIAKLCSRALEHT